MWLFKRLKHRQINVHLLQTSLDMTRLRDRKAHQNIPALHLCTVTARQGKSLIQENLELRHSNTTSNSVLFISSLSTTALTGYPRGHSRLRDNAAVRKDTIKRTRAIYKYTRHYILVTHHVLLISPCLTVTTC